MTRLFLMAIAVLALSIGAARADNLFWAEAAWYEGHNDQALKLFRQAAAQGDKVAQRRLGMIYAAETPIGAPDYAEAAKWYRLSATQGDAEALDGLALLYRNGDGVPQDYAEALRLLHRAAVKGYNPAIYHLGQMYLAGQGVPHDDLHAYMWFSLGARVDTGEMADARDAVEGNMTKQQIAAAQKLVESCQLHNFKGCD